MNILITGANGFIGKNLKQRLNNFPNFKIVDLVKSTPKTKFSKLINNADIIFHLAGANREGKKTNFKKKNYLLTKKICEILKKKKKKTKFIFTSTIHSNKKNIYGITKKQAEKELIKLNNKHIQLCIYKLTNVFGKWSKPFYNSVVATFCHQILNKKKIKIIKNQNINFLYIDDLVDDFIKIIKVKNFRKLFRNVFPQKTISIKLLSNKINYFNEKLKNSEIPIIKNDFDKKLYSTYLSFMDQNKAYYKVTRNEDKRGEFTELFKNNNMGQVSFFSINKNQTRGNHYHDTKTEKFFLISGKVKFDFIDVITKKKYSMRLEKNNNKVVFTIPGWSHKIKNIGKEKAVFAVWANEKFDRNKPDTYYYKF